MTYAPSYVLGKSTIKPRFKINKLGNLDVP